MNRYVYSKSRYNRHGVGLPRIEGWGWAGSVCEVVGGGWNFGGGWSFLGGGGGQGVDSRDLVVKTIKTHNPEIDDLVVKKSFQSYFEPFIHRFTILLISNIPTFQSASI